MGTISPISPRLVEGGIVAVDPDTSALQSGSALQYDLVARMALGIVSRLKSPCDPNKTNEIERPIESEK